MTTQSQVAAPPRTVEDPPREGRVGQVVVGAAAIIAVGSTLLLLTITLDRLAAGTMTVVLLMALLLSRVHIGVAMAIAGLLGVFNQQGAPGIASMLRSMPHDTSASWSLTVIPMFVLMGMLLWRSGITDKAYRAAGNWLGFLPGGLAVTTNLAGGGLSAASGSTLGMVYALGRVGIPSMLTARYPVPLALASVMTVGTSSQLLPPSLLLVIYSGVAGTVVSDQLLAGIVPGLLLLGVNAVAFVIWAAVAERRRGESFGRQSCSWGERLRSLVAVWPLVLLVVVVLGGLNNGYFTATEAGAVGAGLALVYLLVTVRRGAVAAVMRASSDTVSTVGAIFLLVIGSAILSRSLAVNGMTSWMGDMLQDAGISKLQFLLITLVIYLVLGMFLEPMSMILLSVPILMPMLVHLEVDLVWFGVFTVLMAELGHVTPPVGILLYLVHRLAQEPEVNQGVTVTMRHAMAAAGAFAGLGVVMALLLIGFPDVTGWLAKGG
ncbi:TRAP transporter large permease [Nocardioides sp. L-11A]|uniref:TRAP transporter large permease n=1 Tax=Nocardioides sp. L-11A TaxID=3043848 RepID=UPI00249C542F|nr:TRAP transporter large permease subunit [Nocardioides sp. L-11A]